MSQTATTFKLAPTEEMKEDLERNNGGIRLTTWNVNGIRNPFGYQPWRDNRSFSAMFDILEADIIIMQELKIQRKDLKDDMVLIDGWDCFFSLPRHKKGYSGVAIYTRQSACAPIRAEEGITGLLCSAGSSTRYCDLPDDQAIGGYLTPQQFDRLAVDPAQLDLEGRCVVLEFPAFVLFGVYSPANSNGLRDDYRHAFLQVLDARIRNLDAAGKRVILTGDLNITRDERDSACAEEEVKKLGITHEEYVSMPNRRLFAQLIDGADVFDARDAGREGPVLLDLCREYHPLRTRMFTHWDQKINARPANYGSRIDHIMPSVSMRSWFSDANIQEGLQGSDHCPVYAVLRPLVQHEGRDVHMIDLMNPPGIFKDGQRLEQITCNSLLANSGKLLPEFTKRQNIKDMFKKSSTNVKSLGASQSTTIDSAVSMTMSQNGAAKRKAEAVVELSPPKKISKVAHKEVKDGNAQVKQRSLKTFFQPKQGTQEIVMPDTTLWPPKQSKISPSPAIPAEKIEDKLIDPIETKIEWTKLFSKRDAPRCQGHDEPCQRLQTKVKGPNCGRWFWLCSRPVGPSGKKEHGTQWRCGTFIWASDLGKDG